MGFNTDSIRRQIGRSPHREHSVPIYLTSSFLFDDAEQARMMFAGEEDGYIYSRYSNPNCDELAAKLTAMEKTEDGLATASGMAAVFASFAALLESGDHVVACRSIFGSTHQLFTNILSKWGIEHTYVDIARPESWEKAFRPNTKMLFFETPTNPALEVVDLEWAGALASDHGVIMVVDNCFATPYLQNPADYGADLVVHSTTKFIDGQGRTIGGAVLGKAELIERIRYFVRHTGPAMSPFNAWVLSKSLETLSLRMDLHCSNALNLAKILSVKGGVSQVRYPHLESHPGYKIAAKQMKLGGGIVTFELEPGSDTSQYDRARKFLDSLEIISLSANLGDTRTIATHPASTTHSKLTEDERRAVGITPGLVRVSVNPSGI